MMSAKGTKRAFLDVFFMSAFGKKTVKQSAHMSPVYIHSSSEPYNEEKIFSEKRLNHWLEKFSMEKHQIHCSGHAKGEDLLAMVKDIDAKMLYPIHTEEPQAYKKITDKITIVEEGKKYQL